MNFSDKLLTPVNSQSAIAPRNAAEYMLARTQMINNTIASPVELLVKAEGKRFLARVAGNKLMIFDTATNLFEILEEAVLSHGMMRKLEGFDKEFGGYGTMVRQAKERLLLRSANGERGTEVLETDAEIVGAGVNQIEHLNSEDEDE